MKLSQYRLRVGDLRVTLVPLVERQVLLLHHGEHRLELSDRRTSFRVEGQEVLALTPSKWRGRLRALGVTWQGLIDRLRANRTYHLRITALYKHFPVSMYWEEDGRRVRVENFTGRKTPLYVKLLPGVSVKVDNAQNLLFSSHDPVTLGNMGGRFRNLRYAVALKRLDPRVFTDGFLATSYEE